jgi:hypothetical protein
VLLPLRLVYGRSINQLLGSSVGQSSQQQQSQSLGVRNDIEQNF